MIAREVRLFLVALQFLTRIPLPRIATLPDGWLTRSAKYMPLVGALIGLAAGLVEIISALVFPQPLPAILSLATAIALTGALHEDGLADTADAFGMARSRERSLEIMRDSRIGTFGVLALVIALALKAGALAALDVVSAVRVLIATHAGARLAMVLALAALPYGGDGEAQRRRAEPAMTQREIAVAIVLGVVPGLFVMQASTLVIAAFFGAIAVIAIALVARRRIGGYTGDVLGAAEQAYETVFFIFAAAIISGPD